MHTTNECQGYFSFLFLPLFDNILLSSKQTVYKRLLFCQMNDEHMNDQCLLLISLCNYWSSFSLSLPQPQTDDSIANSMQLCHL